MNSFKNIILNFTYFFTMWTLFMHFLFYIGAIKTTYLIACFVLFFSIIIKYIYPGYIFVISKKVRYIEIIIDILCHWLPFIILFYYTRIHRYDKKFSNPFSFDKFCMLLFVFILYLIYCDFNFKRIYNIYYNPEKFILDKGLNKV